MTISEDVLLKCIYGQFLVYYTLQRLYPNIIDWFICFFHISHFVRNHLFRFHILSKEFKFTSSLIVCLSDTQYRHPVHLSSFDWNEHAYLNQYKSIYNTFQYQIWKWYIFSLYSSSKYQDLGNLMWLSYWRPIKRSSAWILFIFIHTELTTFKKKFLVNIFHIFVQARLSCNLLCLGNLHAKYFWQFKI